MQQRMGRHARCRRATLSYRRLLLLCGGRKCDAWAAATFHLLFRMLSSMSVLRVSGAAGNELLGSTESHLSFTHGGHARTLHDPFVLRVERDEGFEAIFKRYLCRIADFILVSKKLKEHSNLETCCYVAMGASILVAMKPLMDHLALLNATPAFWWLIGGGVSYITGAVFYSLRKPYMHATFHLFCLGGSIGHIIAIWLIL